MSNFNSHLKLPKKGRYASHDIEAFKKALKEEGVDPLGTIDADDFSIEFDQENVSYGEFKFGEEYCTDDDLTKLIREMCIDGVKIPFLPGCAGGDWEIPVCFIIYFSKKGVLRGYVPRKGNLFNAKTKKALGNDEDCDEEFLKPYHTSVEEVMEGEVEYDEAAMLEDIAARLIPRRKKL